MLLRSSSGESERAGSAAILAGQRQEAARDRRGLHQRRRRLPIGEERIEHAVQVVQALEIDLEDEAILAGNAIAFDDLRHRLSKLGDLGELPGHWPDTHEGGDRIAEGPRIDVQTIALDDSRL